MWNFTVEGPMCLTFSDVKQPRDFESPESELCSISHAGAVCASYTFYSSPCSPGCIISYKNLTLEEDEELLCESPISSWWFSLRVTPLREWSCHSWYSKRAYIVPVAVWDCGFSTLTHEFGELPRKPEYNESRNEATHSLLIELRQTWCILRIFCLSCHRLFLCVCIFHKLFLWFHDQGVKFIASKSTQDLNQLHRQLQFSFSRPHQRGWLGVAMCAFKFVHACFCAHVGKKRFFPYCESINFKHNLNIYIFFYFIRFAK